MAGADALMLLDMIGQHVNELTGSGMFDGLLDDNDFAGTAGVVSNFMLRGWNLPGLQLSSAADGDHRRWQ
jgi:hypothetical protein